VTTLILVRHAQSAPRPDLPEAEFPLSELGRQQAQDLVPILRDLGVDALVSSPYQRAVDTLRPYAEAVGLEIAIDDDLRERSLGAWLESVEAVNNAILRMHADLDFCLPGGESGRACLARYEAALVRALDASPGRTIAVGAHGGVVSHFLAAHHSGLAPEFWRSIRNPHLFVFDANETYRWLGERTLAGQGLGGAVASRP
jgi:2,3-bisphosphoglycerate-dependent phosphoglycerate mutase